MYRLALILVTLAALVLSVGQAACAQTDSEYPIPPVKLKPEKPTTAQPIPPTPDPTPAPVVMPPPAPVVTPPPAPVVMPPPAPVKSVPISSDTKLPPIPPDLARDQAIEAPAAPPTPLKPEELQKETAEAQSGAKPEEADLRNQNEVSLVDEVSRTRKAYARAMLALRDYYTSRGNATKLDWVNAEYTAYDKSPKAMYLGVSELGSPTLKPSRRIEAADKLYEEGLQFKDYPAMPAPMSNPGKDTYLKKALEKFQTIIEKYPESDKIDDAAFRMGEIYGGWYFEDWTRAVQCYERCWQWNPRTEYPAVLNAAKIYDKNLKNRAKAVELYNRVLTESNNPDQVKQAREAIKNLTGK
jgi:tetratricopeptide (TPR) repeat protein